MDWAFDVDLLGRVALAAVLGVAIGVERERDGHPAGTRTFAAVAIGAALFGVVSVTGFDEVVATRSTTNINVEVTRIASQVVVGIGFLGAGVIFQQGGTVHNLTTAATLWTAAAVGLAAGVGEAGEAVAVTALMLVLLAFLPRPLKWLLRQGPAHHRVTCTLEPGVDVARLRDELAAESGVSIEHWRVEKSDGRAVVHAVLGAADDHLVEAVERRLVVDERIHALRVAT